MKLWISTVLALCLYCAVSPSFASIGTVATISGAPGEIARGKQKLSGTAGAQLQSDDIVTTKSGVANLKFADDSTARVNENSRLLLDDFVYDPKKSDAGKLALKVGLGAVRYASGQIAKTNPQQVAVRTPTATVSVRGTDFSMVVDEAGRSLIILLPSCRDDQKPKAYELDENRCRVGKIGVTSLGGEVELDRAFQAVWVSSATQKPSKPVILNIIENNVTGDLVVSMPPELARMLLVAKANERGLRNNVVLSTSRSVEIDPLDLGNENENGPVNLSGWTPRIIESNATQRNDQLITREVGYSIINESIMPRDLGGAAIDLRSNDWGDSTVAKFSNQIVEIVKRNLRDQRAATGNSRSVEEALLEAAAAKGVVTGWTPSSRWGDVFISPKQLLELLSAVNVELLNTNTTNNSNMNGTVANSAGGTNTTLLNASNSNGESVATNTTTTLSGASYSNSGNTTNIVVDNAAQLLASCDTITLVCITKDEQKQYDNTAGLLNNGTNPVLPAASLTISRTAETFEHVASVKIQALSAPNHITLIQNDVLVSVQIANGVDVNTITINQRSRR